jgi:PASTA domain
MPGQLSDGVTATRDVDLTNSKAFCEGRQAKAFGLSGGTNQHPSSSEANAAWAAGFALAVTSGLQGPCNITAGVTVPNLVGRTKVQATGDLAAARLVLGTTTLTVDPVASQIPAAAATVAPGAVVNITMTS